MFDIKMDLLPFVQRMDDIATSQLPFATALAATMTAKDVLAAERDEIKAVFDRPTPFSLNAFQVTPATKDNPVAIVDLKTGFGASTTSHPRHWFDPQVEGGPRRPKGFENLLRRAGVLPSGMFAVPAKDFPLDQYGNMPGSIIRQMLSDVAASRDPGQNATARSRKRVKRARYEVIIRAGKPIGIGIRSGRQAKLALLFVPQPNYAARFDFFGVAALEFADRYAENFEVALRRAIATAR